MATAVGRQPLNGIVEKSDGAEETDGFLKLKKSTIRDEWVISNSHGVVRGKYKTYEEAKRECDRMTASRREDSSKSLSGFLRAVAANDYATIEKAYGSGYTTRQKASMGETSGTVGGYLMPQEFSDRMLDKMLDFSIIKPRAMVIPMGSAENWCPRVDVETATGVVGASSLFGGFKATWGASQPPNESEPKFRRSTLFSWDLLAYGLVSNQWLDDAGPRADDYLYAILAGACNWQAEFAYFNGKGAAGTMPLGIIPAPATVQVNRAGANHIAVADVASMSASLLPYSWLNAIWVCSPTALADVTKISGYSINVWKTQEGAGFIGYLNGRPLYCSDKLPALGTLGDLVLFDPSLYAIGERQEVLVERSSLGGGFPTNQTYFRVWYRGDGKPMVQSSITLQDNTTTVSPYVALL